MLKSFVVGTLTTIHTVMTPLSGTGDPTARVFPLVLGPGKPLTAAASHSSCSGAKASFLAMKIETTIDSFIRASVQGQVCTDRDGLEPVSFSIMLPGDLNDTAFLARLPANAAYVVNKVPSARDPDLPTSRVKITRQATTPEGLIPIVLEWLPSDTGRVEHPPVTLWLTAPGTETGPPWARIEFSELSDQFPKPLTLSREISPRGHATKIR